MVEDTLLIAEVRKTYARAGKDMVVLQIGANDGIQDDPLHQFILNNKCEAHLLEPVPRYFKDLVKNYKKAKYVNCHNCAIAEYSGKKKMSVANHKEGIPLWVKGCSTFDESKNVFSGYGGLHLRTSVQDAGDDLLYQELLENKTEEEVAVLTLDDFLHTNDIDVIDIFITDTEGYDWIVFEQLDLIKYHPSVIFMETHGLGAETWRVIYNKLSRRGYTLLTDINTSWNTLAVRRLDYQK